MQGLAPRRLSTLCFIFSGVASLGYQTLWLHEGIARFGIIMPVISALLAVFMLGLLLGTIVARRFAVGQSLDRILIIYIAVEVGIAAFALLVPQLFQFGYNQILSGAALSATSFLYGSALIIGLSLIIPCFLIGTTFPLMMRALEYFRTDGLNFGSLYLGNLIGAVLGCIVPLFLIEIFGGRFALWITTGFNLIAALSAALFLLRFGSISIPQAGMQKRMGSGHLAVEHKFFLFVSGFVAIGSEPLWVKSLTPVLGTSVYAFATILAFYLIFNALGTYHHVTKKFSLSSLWMPVAFAFVIFGTAVYVLDFVSFAALLAIVPISYLFGMVTPRIIDACAQDDQRLAMRAYIYNCAGCIVGPLVTGYILFPNLGLKASYIILGVLLLASVLFLARDVAIMRRLAYCGMFVVAVAIGWVLPDSEETFSARGVLYRDPIGYVAAVGQGHEKDLRVNGIGMTMLTTITKAMVHLPLAYQRVARPDILIICMGMGTTLRSAVSWDPASATVVELNRAVTQAFPYFHADADQVRANPAVRIVVDDGRRFLTFNKAKYDLITIDPPPPIQASGSGLLYSSDFMAIVADRLKPDGVVAHWIPTRDPYLVSKIVAALAKHFPHILVFRDGLTDIHEGGFGYHFLASKRPFETRTAEALVAAMPPSAVLDLKEFTWEFPAAMPAQAILARWTQVPLGDVLPAEEVVEPISDDRLFNEYYLFRHRHVGGL